jgi:hypothetical protein
MGKKSGSGSGIRDEQPGSYFLEFRNHFFGLKYLSFLMRIWHPKSRMETIGNWDRGWKKVGSGINNSDPQHACSTESNETSERVFLRLNTSGKLPAPCFFNSLAVLYPDLKYSSVKMNSFSKLS